MSDSYPFGSLAPPDQLMPRPRNPAMPADWAQNLVRGVAGKLADIVMAPRRAMDQGMTTADATDWAGDVATMGIGAGAPAAVRGAAGIFGGRLAKTADTDALAKAEELAKAGAPREQIWNDTGWFKGGDGKWRFEISDNASLIGAKAQEELAQQGSSKAVDLLSHKDLYSAYPDLKKIGTSARINETPGGSYFSSEINGEPGPGAIYLRGPDVGQIHSTSLHEMQHAVQNAEGLARGSSPEGMKSFASDLFRQAGNSPAGQRYRELEAKRSAIGGSLTPAEQDEMMKIYKDNFDMHALKMDAYRRASGEVEARNVQARRNMTPEERRAKPPWLTEDVPAEQQIRPFGSLAP